MIELDNELEPGRWFRVVDEDGQIWCETSNAAEAIGAIRPGDKLLRQWTVTIGEWRPATIPENTLTQGVA